MTAPRILHVDDDPDILEITRVALEVVGGLEVVQCRTGAQALAVAPLVNPDVFLLDVTMPGMSGEQLLLALRRFPQFAAQPAVFLTALAADDAETRRLYSLGADAVISKPYDPMTLADRVAGVWQATRERESVPIEHGVASLDRVGGEHSAPY